MNNIQKYTIENGVIKLIYKGLYNKDMIYYKNDNVWFCDDTNIVFKPIVDILNKDLSDVKKHIRKYKLKRIL